MRFYLNLGLRVISQSLVEYGMIKNILLLILTLSVLWLARDKYMTTMPTHSRVNSVEQESQKSISHANAVRATQKDALPKVQHTTVIKRIPHIQPNNKQDNVLSKLLAQNKFYDALSYYLEHTTMHNRQRIEQYLSSYAQTQPLRALDYMKVFLDNEPQSNLLQMIIQTQLQQKLYRDAITNLMQVRETYTSELEDKRVAIQLKNTAMTYIDTLHKEKAFDRLIGFLEEMIDYDSQDSYYMFVLAQLYMELDKQEEAAPLLAELEYDDIYAQKARKMIESIVSVQEEQNKYDYAIPLTKYGQHYVVNAVLDGTIFRLMLDTGASYIYIDEDKASSLEIINANMRLQTAGEDVSAQLRKVHTMRVGEVKIENIKVTSASFKRVEIDGLLGMNFLNRFSFFIDQESDTLYLTLKGHL